MPISAPHHQTHPLNYSHKSLAAQITASTRKKLRSYALFCVGEQKKRVIGPICAAALVVPGSAGLLEGPPGRYSLQHWLLLYGKGVVWNGQVAPGPVPCLPLLSPSRPFSPAPTFVFHLSVNIRKNSFIIFFLFYFFPVRLSVADAGGTLCSFHSRVPFMYFNYCLLEQRISPGY